MRKKNIIWLARLILLFGLLLAPAFNADHRFKFREGLKHLTERVWTFFLKNVCALNKKMLLALKSQNRQTSVNYSQIWLKHDKTYQYLPLVALGRTLIPFIFSTIYVISYTYKSVWCHGNFRLTGYLRIHVKVIDWYHPVLPPINEMEAIVALKMTSWLVTKIIFVECIKNIYIFKYI